jgi:acyl carrier protein
MIHDRVISVLKTTLEVDQLSPTAQMDEVQEWDSLKHLQILGALEEEFKIQIDMEDAIRMVSVPNIVDLLNKNYFNK